MLNGQSGLDQSRHSGGCVEMANVTLNRSYKNACRLQGGLTIDLVERRDLNWIPIGVALP